MRQQAVLDELRALHLDVAVGAAGQVLDHVRRHAERPANLNHLILPSLQKLRRFVAAAELVGFHAVRQNRRAERPVCAAVHAFPLLAEPLGSLDRNRVITLQHDARPGTVAKVR